MNIVIINLHLSLTCYRVEKSSTSASDFWKDIQSTSKNALTSVELWQKALDIIFPFFSFLDTEQ